MMVKPIPKALLIHSAVLKKTSSMSLFGEKTFSQTALAHIRIELTHRLVLTDGDTVQKNAGVMYFDMKNSTPSDTVINVGDYIAFGGNDYLVETVRRVLADGKIHHIKATLLSQEG